MPTFLHIADVHLDSAFSAHFDMRQAEMRRGEVRRCLSGILDRAMTVDILLIAGDLFDRDYVSAETISFLKRRFAEMQNTKVFIVAGNHDPYTIGSVYNNENFGDNVHVFGTKPECVELVDIGVRVWGASFGDSFCDERIEFPHIEKAEGIADIMLLHADLTSNDGKSGYNPIDKEFITSCGADYLALGHIHKRTDIQRLGNTYYAYSGAIEGHGFDECGDLGYYIGTIENGVVDARFERASIRRMYREEVDISGVADSLDAADVIKSHIESKGTYDDIYKIILKGRIKTDIINIDTILTELNCLVHYIELKDETLPDYDIKEVAVQNTLCGEFAGLISKGVANGTIDKDVADEAIRLGIELLLGGEM